MNTNTEGLLTAIWGPSTWDTLHCISFNYPNDPTVDEKQHYKNFFESLQFVLPCCTCRESYSNFIKTGPTELTDDVMKNRYTLTFWLYNLHNTVNKKLGMTYNITYRDLYEKYGSYVAECVMTAEQKMIPYKNMYNKEAPYLGLDMLARFSKYAIKRGVIAFTNEISNTNMFDRKSDDWVNRNEKCWNMIKEMRINGISNVELAGEFEGLPTLQELELMKLMSTTLSNEKILNMMKKLGYSIKTIYKFNT